MADLSIKITGTLDKELTKTEINKKLTSLQEDIDKLKINIGVDENVLKKLTELADKLKNVGNATEKVAKGANEGLKGEIKTLEELTRGYKELNKQIKYKRDGTEKSTTSTYQDDKGNGRVINTNSKGVVTSYKDIENIVKFEKEQQKLRKTLEELARTGHYTTTELRNIGQGINTASTIKQLDDLKAHMSNMKFDTSFDSQLERVRQSLKKVYDQGLMDERKFRDLNNAIDASKNISELEKMQQAIQKASDSGKNTNLQQNLLNQAKSLLGRNGSNLDVSGVNNLINNLKRINPEATNASNELKRLQQQLRNYSANAGTAARNTNNLQNQLNSATGSTKTFANSLKDAFKNFSVFSMTGAIFYAPVRALQDMTQRLIEVDTLMTDIRRVMDMPDFKFTELLQQAVDTSDELSTKLKDTLSMMGDFGRMGFDSNQLVDITKTAQVLQNISDLDATSSVDTLTSAMLNFNIAADQSITIADKLNEVDNNYAISTKDLSDGIRKAAATAKTFGVDINELTGYIAAIGSTTRESGAIVGNGLKTIFSRITTMDDAATSLQSVGVSIRDMSGNVRDVSDILGDLSGKWTNLSDEQKQNLGVTIAGRYQLTRFLALMNNFSIAQSATATAVSSSGSAMKEQAKYADSLEARINRLDTAWNKFTLAMGNAFLTDSLVSGIETLNSLATTVAGFVNKFGALGTVFGIIGTTIVALNTKFKTFSTSLLFGTTGMTRMQLASAGLATSMTRLEVAMVGVKATMRGLVASSVVGLAFVAVGYAIEKLIGSYSDAKQEQEDFEASQQKGVDSLTNNRQEIEKLIAQYEQMSRAKKTLGDNWSSEQETKYLQVQQQLSDLYPQLIDHIDGAGNAHLKTKTKIEKEIEATDKLIEAKKKLTKATAISDFDKQLSKMDDLQNKAKDKSDPIKNEHYDKFGLLPKIKNPFDVIDKEKIAQNKYEVESLQNQWANAAQKINSKVLEVSNAYSKLKIDSNIQKSVDDFVSSLDLSKIKSPEKLDKYAQTIAELSDKMQKAFQNGDEKAYDKAQDKLVAYSQKLVGTKQHVYDMSLSFGDLKKAVEMGANAIFAGKDGMDGLDESATGATDSVQALTQASMENASVMEQMVGTTQDLIDQTKDQITTYQMLSNVENLSAEQKTALANATAYLNQLYPQFIENGKLNVEQMRKQVEAEEILLKAVTDVANGHADAEEIMTTNQALQSKNRLDMISDQISAYQKLIEAAYAAAEADGGEMTGARSHVISSSTSKIADLKTQVDALSNTYSAQVQRLADATGYQGQYYAATEKSKDATDSYTYVSDKFKLALENVNTQLEKYNKIMDKFPNYSDDYQDALKNEIKLLQQKEKLLKEQANTLDKQIKSGKISQTGVIQTNTTSNTTTTSTGTSTYSGKYADFINKAASTYGVDPNLIASIIKQESGFNPNARSGAGAKGLMQLMPGTAKELGVKNAYDPYESIMAGTKYFVQQLKAFGGNVQKALAAYNAGAGNVRKYGGIPPFKETQNYVKNVLANYNSSANKTISTTVSSGMDALLSEARKQSKLGTFTYKQIGGAFTGSYQQFLNRALSDCSQFVQEYFQNFLNTNVPRTAAEQWNAGQAVKNGQQQIGDLVFWNTTGKAHSHVGIYTGNGKVMQMGTKGLKEINVNAIKNFEGYRRIPGANTSSSASGSTSGSGNASKDAAEAQQNIDDAKLDLLQLQQDASDVEAQIQAMQLQLIQSVAAAYDHKNKLLEDDFAEIDYKQKLENENSKNWISLQLQKEKLMQQEKKNQQDAINYLKNQIKYNKNLTQAQKDALNDDIISRTQQLYELETNILSERESMAEKLIDVYKSVLEAQKQAALDTIDKMIDGINKKAEEDDYNKQLSEKQKGRQDILTEMANLSMDNSSAAKKRLAELQKELDDSNKDITDMQDGHTKDLRIDNLNGQKDTIEKKYDDLLNDERKFAKMRSDIIAGHTNDILKILNTFFNDIKSKASQLGTSNANNILDQITSATSYASGTKTTKDGQTGELVVEKPINLMTVDKNGKLKNVRVLNAGEKYRVYGYNSKYGYNLGGNQYVYNAPGFVKYQKFDTGGMTPDWAGDDGKLAMLHKKEIVLNKMDTSNLLKTINFTRDLVNKINIPNLSDLFKQPSATTGGSTINISFNVEKMNGNQKDVDFFMDKIIKGVNAMGGTM
jgi:TP901 family phage tail tape measure protein